MKKLLLLLLVLLCMTFLGCKKLTNSDASKRYETVKEYILDDENWNGLYTYLIYDEVHVHQSNTEDDGFVKPIIKNIFSLDSNDYNVTGAYEDNGYILIVKLKNKVFGNIVIDEYKVTAGDKIRIEFSYLSGDNNKTYDFYIVFNKGL